MRYLTRPALGLAFGLSCVAGAAEAQLEINLDYSAFLNGPSGNVNTILNGASLQDAIDAMEHAAAIWEDVFANASSSLSWANNGVLTKNIDVSWTNHTGSTLATGGTGAFFSSGRWSGDGRLRWDGDGTSGFFVDTTPGDDAEWRQRSERSTTLGGVSVNIERVSYDAPPGVVRDNNDLLSTALHEMAHTFGWANGYPLYDDADLGNDNDIDITSGPFNGAQIPVYASTAHTNLSIPNPGNDALGPGKSDYPYHPGGNSFFSNFNYNPTNLAPSTNSGVRTGLTEADILVVAQFLEFDMASVNFAPDPNAFIVGDLNGDSALTNGDIAPFVQALTDPAGYASTFPEIDPDQVGDFTGDSTLTNGDIAGFVAALTGSSSTAVPEPTSLALMAIGGLVAARRRR